MRAEIENDRIYLYDSFKNKEMIKTIFGRIWHPEKKAWSVPHNALVVKELGELFNLSVEPRKSLKIAPVALKLKKLFIPHLYDHQKQTVAQAVPLQYFADLSQPGTGKTMAAIELLLQRSSFPALVIAPLSILDTVWKKEIEAVNFGLNPKHQINPVVLSGGSAKINEAITKYRTIMEKGSDHRFCFIINYEIVRAVLDNLSLVKWGSIILDESTKIKTPQAKRSKAIVDLSKTAQYKHIMTGTLAPNGLMDGFNQIRFLSEEIFGSSWFMFRQHFFTQNPFNQYEWNLKPGSLEVFQSKIKNFAIQHMKADCTDLPPLTEEIREYELSRVSRKAYNEMKEEALLEIERQIQENSVTGSQFIVAPFKITQMMKLRQISSGFIYNEVDGKRQTFEIGQEKMNELRDLLEEINEKVIIFTHFVESRNRVAAALGEKAIIFEGDKEAVIDEFKGEKQYLVANMASAAHGLNLQFCSTIINYEIDFNLEVYLQAMDRINRIGQKNKMTIYTLIGKKTLEPFIHDKLKAKQDLNSKIGVAELKSAL